MKIKQTLYITDIVEFLEGNYTHAFTVCGNDGMHGFNGRWYRIGEIEIDADIDIREALAMVDEQTKMKRQEIEGAVNHIAELEKSIAKLKEAAK